MKKYEGNKTLIQDLEELSEIPSSINELYLDLETTSGDDDISSLNPWKNCEILGAAFTWDEHESIYYLPLRQRSILDSDSNLPIEGCNQIIRNLIKNSKIWINSNVKYDAHVATNSSKADCSNIELVDTITLAKLVDSDRFRYALKHLVHDYLYRDIEHYEQAFRSYLFHPGGHRKCSDYGVIPLSLMVPYACQDVIDVRDLYPELLKNLHEDSNSIWETERKITKVLYHIEQTGVELDIEELVTDYVKIRKRLSEIEWRIKELTGFLIKPNTNADCYNLLHNHYGLPVIEETKKGEPSYNKEALRAYLGIPAAPHEVIKLIQEFRESHKLWTGFIVPYIIKCSKTRPSYIHCSFNQVVRTGRMSCGEPNLQQLPIAAKKYIVPGERRTLIDFDLKQIEYRFIAHYTKNEYILTKYQSNPDTDFHDTMAELCEIERGPAKNMNFAVSFGAGEAKTVSMLMSAFDLSKVPEGEDLESFCKKKGKEIYKTYHNRFPELRRTAWRASGTLRQAGYVKNLFGRIRRMPYKFHFKAFNNVIQSSAADLMKEMTVRLHNVTKDSSANLLCLVHDSWLFSVPTQEVDYWKEEITKVIEETPSKLTVPIYASNKSSELNWKECSGD